MVARLQQGSRGVWKASRFRSAALRGKDSNRMLSQIWSEIAFRVYDSPVLLGSNSVNGLIVSENFRATRKPMHIFLRVVAQIERRASPPH